MNHDMEVRPKQHVLEPLGGSLRLGAALWQNPRKNIPTPGTSAPRRAAMLAIKARYNSGHIELIEPMPADILSAELNVIVIPSEKTKETTIPAGEYSLCRRSSDEEFKQTGLASFFDTEDDADVDWEDYFELK